MPMIMAMTLYLWDVLYGISLHKVNNDKAIFCTLLMIILFMVFFVFSMLANHNIVGWTLFMLSWLALTILKYETTEDEQTCPYQIPED